MPLDIDWNNPRYLKRRSAAGKDLEALSKVKERRRKHKGGKAHSTGKELSAVAKRKSSKSKHKLQLAKSNKDKLRAKVRAFWRGDSEVHP